MQELTGFQRDLMFVIAGLDGPHGLAVKAAMDDYYESEVHHGRLYPNLNSLVNQGFVEKSAKDQRTNEYQLTDAGTAALSNRRRWTEDCCGGLLDESVD